MPEAIKKPPFSFAMRHGVLVTGEDQGRGVVICRRNFNPMALVELRRFLRRDLQVEVCPQDRFDFELQRVYEGGSGEAMQLAGDLSEDMDLQSIAQQLGEPEDLLESQDDAPIIRLINGLFTEAVKINASDIHIEPFESRLRVRFRVDGVLRDVLQPSRMLSQLIISRVKVMARLDIAEKRLPQDGRISLKIAGRPVDVRVSTIPSAVGERVVLRLLDKQAGRLDLEQLGMAPDIMAKIDTLIRRPNGIVLVTGPTGSGKTTTLYSVITRLNDSSRSIMTVEDPIEYFLDGIGQTQVNQKVKMTFAAGLRAILRQDPDIVMVGEIRDVETAEIAVQASLTGHLVFSTLHTNTAVGAVTRLRDMGVEPFLLASTLAGVLSQRLIRLLCPECRQPYQASVAECEKFDLPVEPPLQFFKPSGCKACNFQGYAGRTGIYELVLLNDAMRSMIHDGASEQALEAAARNATPDMRHDGLRCILAGVTSVEEVVRVTSSEVNGRFNVRAAGE